MPRYRVTRDDSPVAVPFEADDDQTAASQARTLSTNEWAATGIWSLECDDGERWHPVMVWVPRINFSLYVTSEEQLPGDPDGRQSP